MLDGWNRTYNIHALNHITKPVEFPDAALGVSDAEKHDSVDGVVKYPTTHLNKSITEPELATQSYELTQIDGFSDPITEKNFPSAHFMGDAIGKLEGY